MDPEVPGNTLLLKFKRPSNYMGILVTSWGVVVTLSGIVRNYGGSSPAESSWVSLKLDSSPVPSSPSRDGISPTKPKPESPSSTGLLAFAIAKLDGVGGVAGWRWIFILEGVASVLAGISTFFLLIDTPALSGRWLTEDEKKYPTLR
ncbi:hypothetical protein ACJZ2D_014238 [Fusarium nematophilum]